MKYRNIFTLVLVIFAATFAVSIVLPYLAQAGKPAAPAGQDISPAAVTGELWKLGITIEGGPPAYTRVIGQLAGAAAAFRSNRGADLYYVFPAPATQKTVQSARLYILDRTGTYSAGTAALTLEVFDFAGTSQRTVSAASLDLQAAASGAWTVITLSGTTGDLQINPGEFLAFHLNLSGGAAGDLDVRPVFEVEVQ